ncbi:hypothetical protein HDU97_005968 [Phlyctochytrium planicorne]|nr:hypothetical protein HDU97_005968 [Phlyctochytrium planicorne]
MGNLLSRSGSGGAAGFSSSSSSSPEGVAAGSAAGSSLSTSPDSHRNPYHHNSSSRHHPFRSAGHKEKGSHPERSGSGASTGHPNSSGSRRHLRFSLQQIEPLDLPPEQPTFGENPLIQQHPLQQVPPPPNQQDNSSSAFAYPSYPYSHPPSSAHQQYHHPFSGSDLQQKDQLGHPSPAFYGGAPFSALSTSASSGPVRGRSNSYSSTVFQSARESFSFSDALPDTQQQQQHHPLPPPPSLAQTPSLQFSLSPDVAYLASQQLQQQTVSESSFGQDFATSSENTAATPAKDLSSTDTSSASTANEPSAPLAVTDVEPHQPLEPFKPAPALASTSSSFSSSASSESPSTQDTAPSAPTSEETSSSSATATPADQGATSPTPLHLPTAVSLANPIIRTRGSLASRRSSAAGGGVANERIQVSPLSLTLPKSGGSHASGTPHPNTLPSLSLGFQFQQPHPLSSVVSSTPNHLQPPRLNLSFFSGPSATFIPDSPMSAGGPKPGAQVATVLATAMDPATLPVWLDRLAAKGPVQAPAYLERMFRRIEETEYQRNSANLPPGTVNPFASRASSERGNLRRNRYTDIVPYDRFRVPLRYATPVMTGNGSVANPPRFSDYINATFLDTTPNLRPGPNGQDPFEGRLAGKKYISTQGPLPETVKDFWGMVWDQGVRVIVMLTKEEERGRPKCHRYWPGEDPSPRSTSSAGGLAVGGGPSPSGSATPPSRSPASLPRVVHPHGPGELEVVVQSKRIVLNGEVVLRELVVRRFAVKRGASTTVAPAPPAPTKDNQPPLYVELEGGKVELMESDEVEETGTRTLWHVHYLNWPDHKSSSARTVLEVIDLANSLQAKEPNAGPMLVHCSAGCGRTGTFCVIDSVLHQLESGMLQFPQGYLDVVSSATVSPAVTQFRRFQIEGSEDADEVDDPILACVMRLRERRVAMVQTLEQFAFCYEAVVTRMIDWAVAHRKITWTPVDRPSVARSAVAASAGGQIGGPTSATVGGGPRSAGGWGRPPSVHGYPSNSSLASTTSIASSSTSAASAKGGPGPMNGLESVAEGSPTSPVRGRGGGSPGVPQTPLVPPTPGPHGMAFDFEAALKRVSENYGE